MLRPHPEVNHVVLVEVCAERATAFILRHTVREVCLRGGECMKYRDEEPRSSIYGLITGSHSQRRLEMAPSILHSLCTEARWNSRLPAPGRVDSDE